MLKNIYYTAAITFFSLAAYAQPATIPAAYPVAGTAPVNYIRTWDVSAPIATEADLLTRPLRDVKQATQYMDGLGRPLQTVIKQGSMVTGSAAVDLVSPQVYDAYGREQYKYLPFAANNTGGNPSLNDGGFKRNPFQEQAAFATAQYPGETYYYSKTNFEASPLNTILNTYAPGNSWAGSEANTDITQRRNMAVDQYANTVNDIVWIWNVALGSGNTLSTYSSPGNYQLGELLKTITKDEQGKQVIEYKDREGHTILKKVQLTAAADDGSGSNMTGWFCTYYLYDDFGDLSCVIPPKAVQGLLDAGNTTLTSTMLTELCFRYEYDGRRRMTMKQVPGAGVTSMVYDALDRLILVQDANNAIAGKWMYTRYDALSRPVSTGLWTLTIDRASLQMNAYSSTTYPASVTGSTFEDLTHSYYDNYAWTGNVNATRNTDNDADFYAASSSYPYPQALTQSYALKGMVTGTTSKQLGGTDYLLSDVNYYDEYGRMIQYQKGGILDGTVLTTQYSYGGQVLQTVEKHSISDNIVVQFHTVQTRMTYDDLGRVTAIKKKMLSAVGDVVSKDWTTISTQQYDAAGQLIKKNLGNKPGEDAGTPLAKINYEYNIRGWLSSLNKDYVTGGANNDEYFGMSLGYDKAAAGQNNTAGTAQYNGNINAEVWRGASDGEQRKYDFKYDAVNRLMKADFTQYTGGSWNLNAGIDFSMKMGNGNDASSAYDENGNIKGMTQTGLKVNASSYIDQLTYNYITGTNKLQQVTDGANDYSSGLGDFKYDPATKTTTDYGYDANGNMNADKNKNIQNIQYNYLNLPQLITIPGKGTISYSYSASGEKLLKETIDNSTAGKTITTDTYYSGGFVYESKHTVPANTPSDDHDFVLQFYGQEEGRVRWKPEVYDANNNLVSPSDLVLDYMLKDHLGNVRVLLTEEQATHHYAATVETAVRPVEDQLFGNIEETAFPVSSINSGDLPDCDRCVFNYSTIPDALNYNDPDNQNEYVSKLNGSGKKIGPTLTLKVMAGDKIDLGVKAWYPARNQIASSDPPEDVLNSLLGTLSNNASGLSGGHATAGQLGGSASPLLSGLTSFLGSHPETAGDPHNPKAYINWVLFDEQFNYVPSGSGFIRVGDFSDDIQVLAQQGITAPKSGYLFVYLSNETEKYDVFFDDLVVDHTPGPLVEETHYYPFGLTQTGISSEAAMPLKNNKKYNGIEFDKDLDLNMGEAVLRDVDVQTGRWWQPDPKIDEMYTWTPYASDFDNPIRYEDHKGDEPGGCPPNCPSFMDDPVGWVNSLGEGYTKGEGKLYEANDWFNRNINPLGIVVINGYAGITGKDLITGESKDRGDAITNLGVNLLLTISGAKAFAAAENIAFNTEMNAATTVTESQATNVAERVTETKAVGPYTRPANATTQAQRASVQGKPCVTCGESKPLMVADHKTPLVQEHYETGTIDKVKMRSLEAVQPQCPTCSAKQGGQMSAYSKAQKALINGL